MSGKIASRRGVVPTFARRKRLIAVSTEGEACWTGCRIGKDEPFGISGSPVRHAGRDRRMEAHPGAQPAELPGQVGQGGGLAPLTPGRMAGSTRHRGCLAVTRALSCRRDQLYASQEPWAAG